MNDTTIAAGEESSSHSILSTSDALCSVCRETDLQGLLLARCGIRHELQDFGHLHTQPSALRLTTLQHVSSTTSCPICRLIFNCVLCYGKWLDSNSTLRLRPEIISRDSNRTIDHKIYLSDPDGLTYGISIEGCRQNLKSKSGEVLHSHGLCHWVGVGVILPVNPCRNEETVAFETTVDNSRSKRDSGKRYCTAYTQPVGPHINTELVRKWVAHCTEGHTDCRETGIPTPESPATIRLIDVENKRIVLHDISCRYIALSYVWGSNTKGVLTRSTVDTYTLVGSLDHEDIPLTIRDAIGLVADLGERYLWVDSVCIIQDNLDDKAKYLPLMGDIYNAATMVVVAAVKSAHSGLPGRGSLRRQQFRPTEIIEGITFTIGAPSPQDQLISTTWNRRGWTYQEAELARRVLVIAESQVYWSCREENWCEDRFTEFLVPTISSSVFNSRLTTQTSPLRSRSLFSPTIGLCYLGEYGYKVKEFSDRSFSDPKDMLWAFLGILKSLLPLFPEGYIWGMPRARLDATLLWQTDNKSRLSDPLAILTKKGRWQELTIPSWCWIGKGAKVWYEECYESVESMLDWREPVDVEEHGLLNGNPEAERGKEWASDIQSTIFQSSHSFSGDTIFDYALLHFAAESATLRLHTPTWGVNRVHTCCSFVSATISLLSGKDIGSVKVPLSAFCDENTLSRREIEGEFILLSSIARRNEDGTKISEEPRYNIMLLSWSKDKKIAYRVSWTDIAKSAWDECETQKKTIILG